MRGALVSFVVTLVLVLSGALVLSGGLALLVYSMEVCGWWTALYAALIGAILWMGVKEERNATG